MGSIPFGIGIYRFWEELELKKWNLIENMEFN